MSACIRIPAAMGGLLASLFAASAAQASHIYSVDFTALNNSGVTGTATLTLLDDSTSLNVMINAMGLEPGGVHVGHIHGLFTPSGMPTNSTTPPPSADTDNDGFIELAEGLPFYGPVILGFGNVDPDLDGVVNFNQTFNLLDSSIYADNDMDGMPDFDREDLLGPGLNSLQLREIVLHGMTVAPGIGAGTPGEVNGTNGYLTVLPVASGEITPGGPGAVPEPSTWAMLLIGFGATGVAIRRRRKTGLPLTQVA